MLSFYRVEQFQDACRVIASTPERVDELAKLHLQLINASNDSKIDVSRQFVDMVITASSLMQNFVEHGLEHQRAYNEALSKAMTAFALVPMRAMIAARGGLEKSEPQ